MQGMLTAPRAVLLQLQASFQCLLILLRVVVHMLANRALQVDQIILRHSRLDINE